MQKKKEFIPQMNDIFKEYGENLNFSNHAFPLFLFTSRLYEKLKEDGCKNIFFMSREGQFLKRLFDRYCEIKKENGDNGIKIKSHYFFGSRNSIMKASLNSIEEENFEHLFRFFNYMSARSFMYSLGFADEQINAVNDSLGKIVNKKYLNFKHSKAFKLLKINDKFLEFYNRNREEQSLCFTKYMDSFGVDYKKEGLYFVDIGYHGTMQDLIFKFFKNNVKIHGYYIKNRAKIVNPDNNKVGLLSDANNKELFGSKINKYDAYNYEQILRADHGRCLGYEIVFEQGVPIVEKKLDDVEIYEKNVKLLQDQIFDKFEKIANKLIKGKKDISKICVVNYYFTVKNKSKFDFEWILNMQDRHHDDFGFVGYPGKIFSKKLRHFAFKFKDIFFLIKNKICIKKLIKTL